MAQELIQTQEQQLTQQQQQRLTAQQVMVVRMLEMPLAQLEQNIQAEMDENPALEGETQEYSGEPDSGNDSDANDTAESFEDEEERKEREDELDDVLDRLDKDDRLESSNYERTNNSDPDAEQEERIYGNTESFYDSLHEQVREQSLTEKQEVIMEYLIGSLDNDGLLRKTPCGR